MDADTATGAVRQGFEAASGGDWDAAEAHFRRADELGSAEGAFRYGALLWKRGDKANAVEAWRRGADRGDEEASLLLFRTLLEAGDEDGAEATLRAADERGGGDAAFELGQLVAERGRWDESDAAFARAKARGSVGVARRLDRRRRTAAAERLVAALPADGRKLTAQHGPTLDRAGDLMINSAQVIEQLVEQVAPYYRLAQERGAPEDSEALAVYLTSEEREQLSRTIDPALDALNALTTLQDWLTRSHAAPVLERVSGQPLLTNDDELAESSAFVRQLSDELENA